MKKRLLVIVTSFLSLSCSDPDTITADEVREAIAKFDEGWKEKNVKKVDSVLSDSYLYFTQSGGTFSRNSVVQTAGSPQYKLDTVNRRQYDIKMEGHTAVVNTVWSGSGTYYGKPFKDKQRCSITLVKQNGKIEILSEHCTPIK